MNKSIIVCFQYLIACPIGLLMLVKLYSMLFYSIIWDLRHGRKYSDDFHKYLKKLGPKKAINKIENYGHDPMRINNYLSTLKPKIFFEFTSNYIYRWPSLTVLCSALLLALTISWLKILMLIITILSLIFELIHQLVARLILGVADNINKYAYFRLSKVGKPENLIWNTSKVLRDAVSTILVELFVFAFSYSCIYKTIDSINPTNFFPMNNSLSFLDALYFSIVTITTVGFGDIYPLTYFSKLLVISEICMVWSIIVLIVFHYGVSLTTNFEE